MSNLAEVEALIEREKLAAARDAWGAWVPTDAMDGWDRERTRARLCRPTHPTRPLTARTEWHATLDEIAVESLRLARDPRASGRAGFATLSQAITIAMARRLGTRAEELIDEGERRFGMSDYAAGMRGRLYTALDRREEAQAVYEEHLSTSSLDQLHQGYAELLYVVGDFGGAIEQLRGVEGRLYRMEALDLEVQAHAALGDDHAVLDALDRALAWSPEGSRAASRLSYRATVRARLNDLDGARADLVSALAHVGDGMGSEADDEMPLSGLRAYVTKRLEALNSATASATCRQLNAFPSVVQKWNYCGPAVLEICLRYVGIGLDQDFIAEAVKKGAGTPMHELVAFLREQGVEARRVEATVDVVKASLDLGYPVILEDDYSSSRHVVVAIGYDERLGTLTVANPMNHAPIPTGIELRDRVAREHRFAGVVVMGRTAELTTDDYAAADRAGLVTPPYLPLFDEAGRSDLSPIAHLSRPNALEIIGLTTQVLDQQPAFPAAEAMRIGAASSLFTTRSPMFVDIATEARARQPHLAEVPLAIAQANQHARRSYEQTGEASRATQHDPADPRTWALLGSALSDLGAQGDAYAAASRALLLHPSDPGALTTLAFILTQECARRASAAARANGTARPAVSGLVAMFETTPWQRLDIADDVLLSLTEHVTYAAAHVDEHAPGGPAALSIHLWLAGDLEGAQAALEDAKRMAPDWTALTVRELLLAEERRDLAGMRDAAARIACLGWLDDALWLSAIESLVRVGLYSEASAVANAAINVLDQPTPLIGAWIDAHCLTHAPERHVVSEVHALAAHLVSNNDALSAVAAALSMRGLDDVTVDVFHRVVDLAPDHLLARHEYAMALGRVGAERAVIADAWSEIASRVPWHTAPLVTWAWAAMTSEPRAVLERLEAVDESLAVLDAKIGAARAAGDSVREAEFTARLTSSMSDDEHVISLIHDHLEEGRFHQAQAINSIPQPPTNSLSLLEMWINVMRRLGRPDLVRDHADVMRDHLDYIPIARAVALINDQSSPLDEPALKRLAEFGSPHDAQWAQAHLALRRGDSRVAARAAAPHVTLLSEVAQSTTDATLRGEIVTQMKTYAPHALDTLSAAHSHALWTGDLVAARDAAHQIREEFPANYRAYERLAECEAADGHVTTAIDAARRAIERNPQSGRAWEALAWALSLSNDWDGAANAATQALGFPASASRVAKVVLAADREREIASLLTLSTGSAYAGFIEACRRRG